MDPIDDLIRQVEALDAAMFRQWRDGAETERGAMARSTAEALARFQCARVSSSETESVRSH